jgi:hypothetical protein
MYQRENTKTLRVKRALRKAGTVGMSNLELSKITLRYGSVIHRLRKKGFDIETVPVNPSTGYYKFIWKER